MVEILTKKNLEKLGIYVKYGIEDNMKDNEVEIFVNAVKIRIVATMRVDGKPMLTFYARKKTSKVKRNAEVNRR